MIVSQGIESRVDLEGKELEAAVVAGLHQPAIAILDVAKGEMQGDKLEG